MCLLALKSQLKRCEISFLSFSVSKNARKRQNLTDYSLEGLIPSIDLFDFEIQNQEKHEK